MLEIALCNSYLPSSVKVGVGGRQAEERIFILLSQICLSGLQVPHAYGSLSCQDISVLSLMRVHVCIDNFLGFNFAMFRDTRLLQLFVDIYKWHSLPGGLQCGL